LLHLNRDYGRKSGWLRHQLAVFRLLAGRFGRFEQIDWNGVKRVVFVCKGNICRSAYAEAKARELGLETASFGLDARDGVGADPQMTEVAGQRGLDLTPHRAQSLRRFVMQAGDLLVALEPNQADTLIMNLKNSGVAAQVTLLGLYDHPRRPHVEDPFGLTPEYFDTCCGIIDRAVGQIQTRLQQRKA
jgi:protein-tyrosine phosphatase